MKEVFVGNEDKTISKKSKELEAGDISIEAQETKQIDEGKHEGFITAIEYREEPFEYIDVYVDCEGVELKTGFPAYLTKNSGLGRFLQEMGIDFNVGDVITLKDMQNKLVGKKISFLTANQVTEKGIFAKILNTTIKAL